MSASIITFSDLGRKQSLSAATILPVLKTFSDRGVVERIVCKTRRGSFFPRTISAIPLLLHYAMRVVECIRGERFSRRSIERWFDRRASRKLGHPDLTLFHGGYLMPVTNAEAEKGGSIRVDLARTAHPALNAALEREEAELLGVSPDPAHFYWIREQFPGWDNFEYVIATSEFVRESYVAQGFPRERIYVAQPDVSNPVVFVPQEKKKSEDVFRALYVGYTTPLKGLIYLIEAWEQLNLPKAELVIVGGYGDIPPKLQADLNQRIAAIPSITWVGATSTPETYYRSADVFVFPSLTEGFSRAILEALSSGLPVLTTENAKAIVEDGKNGYVVPIRNSEAIAKKLRYLYDHPEERERMGKAAIASVSEKPPFGEAVYAIYQDILKREGIL